MNIVKGLLIGSLLFGTICNSAPSADARGGKALRFHSGFMICANDSGELRVKSRCNGPEQEVSLTSLADLYEFDGQLVTPSGITIESDENEVSIIAGASTISIDPLGGIEISSPTNLTLQATGDITLDATGNLNLNGNTVNITSAVETNVSSDIDTNIHAGISLEMDGSAKSSLKSGGVTEIKGSLVQIN